MGAKKNRKKKRNAEKGSLSPRDHGILMAKRRYQPRVREIPLDHPGVIEYVNFLKRSNVEPQSIRHWLLQPETGESPTASAQRHFESRCFFHNFGKWALRIVESGSRGVPEYVKSTVRSRYDNASADDRSRGLLFILTGEFPPSDALESYKGNEPDDVSVLLEVAEIYHEKNYERAEFDAVVEALWFVGAKSLANAFREWSAGRVEPTAAPASQPRRSVSQLPAERPVGTGIGAIAVDAQNCNRIRSLVRNARSSTLTADASYLAAELTTFYVWRAVFEEPLRVPNGDSYAFDISNFRVAVGVSSLVITYFPVDRTLDRPQVAIPVNGMTSVRPESLEHSTVVLLNYFFADTICLETSSAKRDVQLMQRVLAGTGDNFSTLYRPTGRSSLGTGRAKFILKKEEVLSRREHDVRGHFRTVNGTRYPVKPHRRES